MITSELLPAFVGPGSNSGIGIDLIEDGYAFRPGLLSLIDLAVSASKHANQAGLDTGPLAKEIESAKAIAKTPVNESAYAQAMRALRNAIKSLDVPEAKLPVLNQFATEKW
jgi:hypothetical protein